MKIYEKIFPTRTEHTNQALETFLTLPLTEEYKEKIQVFITDFSNKTLIELLRDRKEMESRKAKLAAVHPLRHIAFLVSQLSPTLQRIQKSDIKWSLFINGMGQAIKRVKKANSLYEYLPGFSDFLKADKNIIQNYIDQENFKGMFEYLLHC